MNAKLIKGLMGVLLASLAGMSFAAPGDVTCVPSNPSFTASFAPTTSNVTLMNVTITCVRPSNTGQTTVTATYAVAAGNGSNFSGSTRRARLGVTSSYVQYGLFKDSACPTSVVPWNATSPITRSVTVTSGAPAVNFTEQFYVCIPANTALTYTSGHHTDSVILTVTGSTGSPSVAFSGGTGTLSVDIFAPVTCTVSTAPGTINFGTYTAFGGAKSANTPFGINCSNTLPYTIALDNVNGVAAGLNYTLGLSVTAGSTGAASLTPTGTGVAQAYFINGNMVAGQAGNVTKPTTDTRTLTLTY